MEGEPAIDAAGNGPRKRSVKGDAVESPLGEGISRHCGRCAPASVETMESPGFGLPIEGEHVAAQAATHRLDESEHRVGSDGSIHRAPPPLQDVESCSGGERLACRHHAVDCHDRFPGDLHLPAHPHLRSPV